MGSQATVATVAQQLVRVPTSYSLYFRLSVTNVAASLISLLPGGALPQIPNPNVSGPAGTIYAFKFVDLQGETDPGTVMIRYTADGQTVPVIGTNKGFVLPGGTSGSFLRIPADPQDIQLVAAVAGPTFVQCYLGIGGHTTGTN